MINKKPTSGFQTLFKSISLLAIFTISIALSSFDYTPKSALVVVIDPGHGGKDPGAQSSGLNEKDICLSIAQLVKSHAKGENIEILLSRNSDEHYSLSERVAFVNSVKPDLLLSLHISSASSDGKIRFTSILSI